MEPTVLEKIDAVRILTHAIAHLEALWPERTGRDAIKPFCSDGSYSEYSACKILEACRQLVRYTS